MKHVFYAVALLLSWSAINSSCSKNDSGGSSSLIGDWLGEKVEVYCDGKLAATNPCYVHIDAYNAGADDSCINIGVTFTKDGYVSALGMIIGTYSYSGGIIKYTPNKGNDDVNFVLKAGKLSYSNIYTFDDMDVTIELDEFGDECIHCTATKVEVIYYLRKK